MARGYNFGAGPAMLPDDILKKAQDELLEWQNQGMSVMELSHRSKPFLALMEEAETDLRELLAIPNNYRVLFLNGAARTQFAMVPMNLLRAGQAGDYLVTGTWSQMAFEEAQKVSHANLVASNVDSQSLSVPNQADWQLNPQAGYFYYTPNETITGVAIDEVPLVGEVPVVADMTSCLLSKPIDISRYGLIFAGSQKNIAPAGLTVVIIRDDLLTVDKGLVVPTMLDYLTHDNNHSLYATPPSFNCYMAGLMFKWLKKQGGLGVMKDINRNKAAKLYAFIDASDFYHCPVAGDCRSVMNVVFVLKDKRLDDVFLQEAKERNLRALKGHRSVGGMRASLYNSMPESGISQLIAFMEEFVLQYAH